MKKQKPEGIYATHGSDRLLLVNARMNGKPAVAFYKPGKAISVITMDELAEQVENKPFIEINDGNASLTTRAG